MKFIGIHYSHDNIIYFNLNDVSSIEYKKGRYIFTLSCGKRHSVYIPNYENETCKLFPFLNNKSKLLTFAYQEERS